MSVFKQLFNKDLYYLPFGDSFVFSTECEKNLKMKSFACFFLDFAFVSAFLAFISFSRCWYEQVGSFVKICSSVSWEKCPESNYLENVIYCSKCQNDAMFHIVISRITINLPLRCFPQLFILVTLPRVIWWTFQTWPTAPLRYNQAHIS